MSCNARHLFLFLLTLVKVILILGTLSPLGPGLIRYYILLLLYITSWHPFPSLRSWPHQIALHSCITTNPVLSSFIFPCPLSNWCITSCDAISQLRVHPTTALTSCICASCCVRTSTLMSPGMCLAENSLSHGRPTRTIHASDLSFLPYALQITEPWAPNTYISRFRPIIPASQITDPWAPNTYNSRFRLSLPYQIPATCLTDHRAMDTPHVCTAGRRRSG